MVRGSPRGSFEQHGRHDEADGQPKNQLGGEDEDADHGSGVLRVQARRLRGLNERSAQGVGRVGDLDIHL